MDGRALATIIAAAIATALHLLAGPHAAAARPLVGRLPVATSMEAATTTSAMALAPTAHHHDRRGAAGDNDEDDDDDAGASSATTREGKWLPFAGAHHLPPAYWAHKPVPWVGSSELGGAAAGVGAVEEGGEGEDEEEVVRDRERRHRRRPSYDGDGTSTRKEQLAMWASLLNPKGRGRSDATGWLPAPGIGEAADDEPAAKASDTPPVEGAEGDEPSSGGQGQNYWGNNGN
ncbi:hypothetical protein HU200_044161 [Digitaria exilis]|uniref:Uncharacterized protein n=1 Tax=Digitaria exilis TaxID=1010633 RepID=A0A835EFM4_9POAL|nr:hypothetical protein HU200_044161 [Digitaria exilis]